MKTRKRLYDTHTLHNHKVILLKETQHPTKLEKCLEKENDKKDLMIIGGILGLLFASLAIPMFTGVGLSGQQ